MTDDCVFCKIIHKELPATIFRDGENFMTIANIDPVSDGHCLIISKKHYESILELPSLAGSELISMTKEQILRLKQEGKADGVKIVQNNGRAAGQTVFHYHVHLIPEKDGHKRERHV